MRPDYFARLARQLAIPGFGREEQQKLKNARVVVFGTGGVGCPAALYLAAAGVANLVLVDRDKVELSNLNRQILFREIDVGKYKADTAASFLLELDRELNLETVVKDAKLPDIRELVKSADAVVNSFDANAPRLMVNDSCVAAGVMAVHSFVENFSGNVIVTIPARPGCLRCLIDENYPGQTETPVMGVAAGQAGIIAAAEVIRYLTGLCAMAPHRTFFDLAFMEFAVYQIAGDSSCPSCAKGRGVLGEV